jgi:O-antigen/teichoic acid export membrane protein
VFTLMAVHAQALVHLLYGPRWAHTGLLFAAFCASLPFYSVLSVSGPVLWAINVVRQDLYTQVFSFVVMAVGFYALSSRPLEQVVWLVPLVYLLRAAWIYSALAAHLRLQHGRSLRAVAGGLALSALAVGVSELLGMTLAPLAAMLLSTLATVVLGAAALRLWPHALLAPEFVSLLQNRAAESSGLQTLCRFMGLKPAA